MTDANNSDPFATTNGEQINYVEVVKQKFNRDGELDLEGLARGKYEADNFIEQLKRENEELRRKADQGLAVKDLLDEIKRGQSTSSDSVEPTHQNNPQVNPTQPDDLEKLVRETLTKTELERREAENKKSVVAKLNEVWGKDAATELGKAASTLGVSVKRLEEIGKESPQALFSLLRIDAPRQVPGTATVPTSRVNLPSTGTGERTKSYYDNLYRQNPKLKHDPKTVAQEHRDALRLGPAFFDN